MEGTPKGKLAVIGGLIGLYLGLIGLVPGEWMSPIAKFIFAYTVTAVVLVAQYGSEISREHRECQEIKEEIGYMPRSIKYEKYRREHYIDPTSGDAKVKYDLKIVNTSDDKLNQTCVPILFEKKTQISQRNPLTIEKILIDNSVLEDLSGIYTFECTEILKNGKYLERGYFKVPLDVIGGLEKKDKCTITIYLHCRGIFSRVRKEDWVGIDIYHPIKRAELVVSTSDNWVVKLDKPLHFPDGIEIEDKTLKIRKQSEMEHATKPTFSKGVLIWNIEKPKLSYKYRLHFKIIRKRRK